MSKRQAQWLIGGVLLVLIVVASKFRRFPPSPGPSPFYADLNTAYEELSSGRLADAERRLLHWEKELGPASRVDFRGETMRALAVVHFRKGQFGTSEAYLRRTIQAFSESPDAYAEPLADAWESLGLQVGALFRLAEGRDALRKSVEVRRKLHRAGRARLAKTLYVLAITEAKLGEVVEARRDIAEAEQSLATAPEISRNSIEQLKWMAAMLWFIGLPDESARLSRLIGEIVQSGRVEPAAGSADIPCESSQVSHVAGGTVMYSWPWSIAHETTAMST